ncbi:thiamine-binding protein [Agromyces seonyuensis]|uniref:thiamine-binding protein n=1 Tax=Agromyces seonyuensis TaxID=2662446 RepID=UPI003014263B
MAERAGAPSGEGADRSRAAHPGLPPHLLEGEWDEVMDVVKRATEAVGAYGSRVSLVLKADIRPGFSGELDARGE